MSNNNEHNKKVEMAKEVGKLLPETIDKVEHYKAILRAEADLLERLQKRQKNLILKLIRPILLLREKVEAIQITNGILHKQKIFESYIGRKKKYEKWLDEMAVEVNSNFDKVMTEAKELTSNIRLIPSIKSYEETSKERTMTVQERVEFYLYMQQEIKNHQTHGKKRR